MPKIARKPTYKSLVQLLPLSADDCEGLRMSIAANGVIVPIIVWPKGKSKYIIDGSHRKQIADELGYECPEVSRPDLDEEEARLMARALNLARRQLDREQKRRVIADQLRETPERSVNWIGKMLGVSKNTVASVRDEIWSGCQIDNLTTAIGRDGKRYPVSRSLPINHERYTPSALIDAVHQVLGVIDLDPASSAKANKVVRAKSFFTKRTNGLKKRWCSRVFLNPPFDQWRAPDVSGQTLQRGSPGNLVDNVARPWPFGRPPWLGSTLMKCVIHRLDRSSDNVGHWQRSVALGSPASQSIRKTTKGTD